VSKEVSEKLKEILASQGIGIIEDPKRLENLLRDYCPQNRKEIRALIDALKEGVPGELKAGGKELSDLLRARLVKRLQDSLGLNDELIGWCIDSWSGALEVCEVQSFTSTITNTVPTVGPISSPVGYGKGFAILCGLAFIVIGLWITSSLAKRSENIQRQANLEQ